VPRLTLLFFGAAKDVPEAAKMVTAGDSLATSQTCKPMAKRPGFQAALRPLKRCTTKKITATISKR
jgi:hypothetical protein